MTLILLPYNIIFILPNHRILLNTKYSKIPWDANKGISFFFNGEYRLFIFIIIIYIYFSFSHLFLLVGG